MAKTETQVTNLKINEGTYEKIQENITNIGENELIITDDKNMPIPSVSDNGKIVSVSSGDYTLSELKTINSTNIIGSGNIDTSELFECTYGTTTYAEITTALSNNKLPVVIRNNIFYIYVCDETSVGLGITFGSVNASGTGSGAIRRCICFTDNTWGNYSVTLETQNNKVTSISSSSTNSEYPSAKLLYDQLSLKQNNLPTIVNDRYLHTNATTGNLEWSQLSVPNVVQDLTTNTAGTLDANAWGTLKSTHTVTIASPTMTGLDSSYEFVNIKLSINSINQFVKLAKNTTNKYSGLFFIEESTNLYEITVYYNGTNIILRCATVF